MIKAYTKTKRAKKMRRAEARARQKALRERRTAWAKVIVAGIAIFFLVFFPNIGKAQALAKQPPLINEGWHSSLEWLKDNSPEPFGGPDFYYQLYETPFQYPETAYGIMSWWDYGYWIMRISHRIPNSNPGQANAAKVARFFVAQDEDSANGIMDKLGSKYVIVDHQMPISKFYAMPTWAGSSQDEFYDTYYVPKEGGKLQQISFFYPLYYQSMVVRLYNFDGKTAVPSGSSTIVISWQWKTSKEGRHYKEVINSWSFPSYEEAKAYILSQESGKYVIGNPDPLVTPVPLEKLEHYKLVHQSDAIATVAGKTVPSVKIFEYTK